MPSTTARGVPFSSGTDAASTIDDTMASLAAWVNDRPGVATLTTAQRDALPAIDKWDGRVIWNSTTARLERYSLGTNTWIAADGVSRSGGDTITASGPTVIPLVVRLAAAQSANALEVRDSGGVTVLASVAASGNLTVKDIVAQVGYFKAAADPITYFNARVNVTPQISSEIGVVIRGKASQTANLQEWQDSAGAVLARVAGTGSIITSERIVAGPPSTTDAKIEAIVTVADRRGLVVRGAPAQFANLQEWQDSGGGVKARVNASGAGFFGGVLTTDRSSFLGGDYGASVNITAGIVGGSGQPGLVVRGTAGQTGNLIEVQNSAATILGGIDAIGQGFFGGLSNALTDQSGFSGALSVKTTSPARLGLIVRGSAGQTTNLQEWQNSGGSPIFYITADGRPGISINNIAATATAGGAQATPASVSGYWNVLIDGQPRKIPYYAP